MAWIMVPDEKCHRTIMISFLLYQRFQMNSVICTTISNIHHLLLHLIASNIIQPPCMQRPIWGVQEMIQAWNVSIVKAFGPVQSID